MFNDNTQKAIPNPRYQQQPTEALPDSYAPAPGEAPRPVAKKPRKRESQVLFPWSDPTITAINQYQRLAPVQQTMLRSRVPMPSLLLWLIGVVILAILAGAAVLYFQRWEFLVLPFLLLLFVIIRWLLAIAKHRRIVHAAERGLIEQAKGEVIKEGRHLIARTANRELRTIAARFQLPPPGPYRFYYVSEGGILLSAQPQTRDTSSHPAAVSPHEPARIALLGALGHSNGFTPEDLDANRSGILSGRQRKMLSRRDTQASLICIFFALVGLVIVVFSGVLDTFVALPATIPHITDPYLQWAPLIFAGVALIIALRAGYVARKYRRDRNAGRVQRSSGKVVRWVNDGKGSSKKVRASASYTYELEKLRFSVSAAAYNALIEGVSYRLYYAPYTKKLLSIEPLEAPAR